MTALCSQYVALFTQLNAEVEVRWLQLVLRNLFHPEVPHVRSFLHKHTSRMYTVPLYEDLAAGAMKSVAIEIFYQTRQRLHPNLRRTLQQILFPIGTTPAPPVVFLAPPCSAPSQPPPASTSSANALQSVNVSDYEEKKLLKVRMVSPEQNDVREQVSMALTLNQS